MSLRILLASFLEKFRGISEKPHEKLHSVGVEDGMRFLDIGCGLGFYSFPASMLIGENGIVYALDMNSEYLDHVATKAGKMQMSNIKTIKADACNTRLPDDSVDIVFLHLVLHDIKDKSAAL
jgi:ubiquinone/menaquinone biosynthesis C-methylase UbiE